MKRIITNIKANSKINDFIHDLLFMDEDKGEIVISLRKLVLEVATDAKKELETAWYGMQEFYIKDCNGYIL